ncbi:MAG TPA: hypothetical protein VEZ90_08180, partial [Blastocatellia bacterium]|nr:hypothetical protein [Blastocatellia bacterium]
MSEPNSAVKDQSSIKYEIDRFLLGESYELVEDGKLLGTLNRDCSAAEVSYGKLIFSCWGDGWARSWKVLEIEVRKNSLCLKCSKQLGTKTSLLELRRGTDEAEVRETRREFADWITGLVERCLESVFIEHSTVARVDRRHLSGNYVRLVLKQGMGSASKRVAAIAASPEETQPVIDAVLGAGIMWLDDVRKRTPSVEQLIVFAPKGRAGTISTRMMTINQAAVRTALYEFDRKEETLRPAAAFDQGDLADNLKRASRNAVWPDEGTLDLKIRELAGEIVRIAPDFIEFRRRGQLIIFSIRGLDFAMVSIRERAAYFGTNYKRRRLTGANESQLNHLICEIIDSRSPRSVDKGSEYYRTYSERWLESILRRNAGVIDPDIDSRHVYSQVPTYRGEQRTFMDLLTVSRGGRLVIMELKVSEDRDFPLQAVD